MSESYIQQSAGSTAFVGEAAVSIYQASVIKTALKLYKNTGMRVNRAYTPTAMLATASRITGKPFKRGQFEQAIAALDIWLEAHRREVPVKGEVS